jgi:ATP-dependent RNA helicase DHX37/DHR1
MAAFPLVPRYSKMIILGQQFGNMPYIIAIVAGLSVGDPFLSYEESQGISTSHDETGDGTGAVESQVSRSIRRKFEETRDQFSSLDPGCDVLRLLCAIGAYECGGATDEFCEERFLRVKIMKEIRKLRIQISNIVNNQLSGIVAPVEFTATLPPPSPLQTRTIKQIVAATYLDHIAIRSDLLDPSSSSRTPKITQRVEYTPFSSLLTSSSANDKRNAIIHPNSAMASLTAAPDYVIYSDLRESQHNGRLRILPLTEVAGRDIEALAKGTPLISYSKPLNYPPPRTFSENGVVKKEVYVVPRFGVQGRGWELPSIKRVENLIKS